MRGSCSTPLVLLVLSCHTLGPAAPAWCGAAAGPPKPMPPPAGRSGRPVDVWVKGQPLSELVLDLSKQAGVRLAADPAVADQKVTIFAKGIDLEDLKKALARLFDYQWLTGGRASTYDYKLFEGRNRARRAEMLRDLPAIVTEAEMVRMLSEWSRSGPPSYMLDGFGDDEKARARFAEECRARAQVLSLLSPAQVRAVLRGGRLRFDLKDLAGEHRAALESFVRKYAMPEGTAWTEEHRRKAYVEFHSEGYRPEVRPEVEARDLAFAIGMADTGPSSGYNVVVEADRYAAALARQMARLRAGERQAPKDRDALIPAGQLEAKLTIAPKAEPTSEAGEKPAAGSEEKEVGRHLADVLEDIAKAAGVSIVSDCHTKPPQPIGDLSGLSLRDALDKVGSAFGHYWNTTGKAYLLRSDRWWDDDAAEVPERLLRRWNDALAANGYLPLVTLTEVVALSDAQLVVLPLALPDAEILKRLQPATEPGMVAAAGTALGFVRFYAALDPKARAAAESKEGLPCRALPEPLLGLLQQATGGRAPHSSTGPPAGPEALADCRLTVRTEVSGREYTCALLHKREQGDGWAHDLKQTIRPVQPKPAAGGPE